MADMADFFPSGKVEFVKPPFDERYWSAFGIPARVRTDLWGGSVARGLTYSTRAPWRPARTSAEPSAAVARRGDTRAEQT